VKINLNHIMCVLIVMSIGILIIITTPLFTTQKTDTSERHLTDFNKGWQLYENGNAVENIDLPVVIRPRVPIKTQTVIRNTLPINLEDNLYIMFPTNHATVEVSVGKKLVYSFGTENKYLFGSSPAGYAWHFVSLTEDMTGQEIEIKYCSPYEKYSGNIKEIFIGTNSSCLYNIIHDNFLNVILCVFLMFLGIVLGIVYIIERVNTRNNKGFLHLSILTLVVTAWSLIETSLLSILFHNVFFLTYIPYFCLMIAPIPFLQFTKITYTRKYSRCIDCLSYLAALNYFICLFFHITGIAEFTNTIFLTLSLIGICCVFALYTSIVEAFIHKRKFVKHFAYCMIIVFVCIIIDIIRYYNDAGNIGAFLRIALLLFIIIPSIDAINKHYTMSKLIVETSILKKLAYTDILTQKANRTAFNKEIDRLEKESKMEETTIVVFDVNNLKQINDTYGHSYGDNTIVSASNAIDMAFGSFGLCYRIGGDEFACILLNVDPQALDRCFERLTKLSNTINQEGEQSLEIAYGYAFYEEQDRNLLETFVRADLEMYSMKRSMKKPNTTNVK